MSSLSRRELLRLSSIGSIGAIAGCTSVLPSLGDQGFSLGQIWITNGHDENRKLSLTITQEEAVIYDNVLELGTDPETGKVEVKPTWTTEPAVYTLTYDRPDMEMFSVELTAEEDDSNTDSCMFLHISFHPASEVPGLSVTPANEHPWPVECPQQ